MSNKFFLRFLLVLLIVSVGFCLRFLYVKYTEWQYLASILSSLSRLKAENGNLTTIAQVCGGLFLLVGLCFTGWNSWIARRNMEIAQTNMEIAQRNMKIAEDGKITDRFSKAVDQLGNDKLEIRLGGIYALERIAIDSEKDHPQMMEVLTAFVRDNSSHRENEIHEQTSQLILPVGSLHPLTPKEKLDTDIQAILTIINRRNSAYIKREKWGIDLSRTYLSKAFIPKANLSEADLRYANLSESNLRDANLSEATLCGTSLWKTDLWKANLSETNLKKAKLWGANLSETDLWKANLSDANLCGANLSKANLSDANLSEANLSDANLSDANLSGVNLRDANLRDANLTGARNLTIDQLSTVKTLYNIRGLDSSLLKQVRENYPRFLEKPQKR